MTADQPARGAVHPQSPQSVRDHAAHLRKIVAESRSWEGSFQAERRRADKVAAGLRAAQADNRRMRALIDDALAVLEQATATPTIGKSMMRELDRIILAARAATRILNGEDPE